MSFEPQHQRFTIMHHSNQNTLVDESCNIPILLQSEERNSHSVARMITIETPLLSDCPCCLIVSSLDTIDESRPIENGPNP